MSERDEIDLRPEKWEGAVDLPSAGWCAEKIRQLVEAKIAVQKHAALQRERADAYEEKHLAELQKDIEFFVAELSLFVNNEMEKYTGGRKKSYEFPSEVTVGKRMGQPKLTIFDEYAALREAQQHGCVVENPTIDKQAVKKQIESGQVFQSMILVPGQDNYYVSVKIGDDTIRVR